MEYEECVSAQRRISWRCNESVRGVYQKPGLARSGTMMIKKVGVLLVGAVTIDLILCTNVVNSESVGIDQHWSISRESEAEVLMLIFLAEKAIARVLKRLITTASFENEHQEARDNRKRAYVELGRVIKWCGAVQQIVYEMVKNKQKCRV